MQWPSHCYSPFFIVLHSSGCNPLMHYYFFVYFSHCMGTRPNDAAYKVHDDCDDYDVIIFGFHVTCLRNFERQSDRLAAFSPHLLFTASAPVHRPPLLISLPRRRRLFGRRHTVCRSNWNRGWARQARLAIEFFFLIYKRRAHAQLWEVICMVNFVV